MAWARARWKLIAAFAVLFFVGVGIGAAGGGGGDEGATQTVTTAGGTLTEESTVTEEVTVEETVTTVKTRVRIKPPPSRGVKVSYGEWEGLFRIHGARVVSSFGSPSVLAQFEYLGGGDCPLGYVEVNATFFGGGGEIVATGLWNTETAPKGTRLPMEISALEEVASSRAELVVTDASCK